MDTNFPTLPTRIEYPLSFDGGLTYIGTDYEYYPPASGAFAGKVKFVTDALGNKTYYEYNSAGQTTKVTTGYGTANALTTIYSYDPLGRLADTTDPQNIVTHNDYDNAGRLTKTTQNVHPTITTQNYQDKYNIVTEYRYDLRGDQIAVIDTYGTITRTYYDLADRPVTVVQNLVGQTIETTTPPAAGTGVSGENIRTDTQYDEAGNVIATVDPAGAITRTYYDSANRPVTIVENLTGQAIAVSTPPTFDPAYPEQNIRTDTVYDANGNVIASIDTLGIITRTYYDILNRPVTVVQHLTGQAISVGTPPARGTVSNIRTDTYYDANGNVILTVDPKEILTRTYYDSLNRPVSVVQNINRTIADAISIPTPPDAGMGATDSNIRTDTYYDKAGNVIATVDSRGVVTRTYYDSANRPYATVQNLAGQDISVTTPPARGSGGPDENVRTDIAYDSSGRRDTTTDALGRITKYEYNEVGQLFKVTANYVNSGSPQNDQNQRNIVTLYDYDALGRQVKTTDTLSRVTLTTYDALSRVLTTTQNSLPGQPQNYKNPVTGDQYNLKTSFTYDVRGNQIAVTDTRNVVTRTYYDALGRSVVVVRNLTAGVITNPTPPARGNPIDPLANLRTDTVYLGNGSVDYTLDELGKKTDYGYDALGRLVSVLDPLLNPTNYTYDANSNRTLMTTFVTATESVATQYEYDGVNRLRAVIENYRAGTTPDNQTNVRTEYTYDAGGNRLSLRDGQSFLENRDYRTYFTYDDLGRLKTETDPLSHMTTYDYLADYVLKKDRVVLTDANTKVTTSFYDELERLAQIDYPSPDADVTVTYDALGRRRSMTDGLGTTSWNYTNIDQPKLITDPFGTGISYDYDPLGNRTALSYGSNSYSYQYNDLNQLDEVTGSGLPNPVTYQYDPAGRLKNVARPNGVNTAYHYFDNGWLQDITHTSGATTFASYQYQYYNNGNRSQAIENVNSPSQPPTATPTTIPTNTPTSTPVSTQTFTPTASPTKTFTPTLTYTPSSTPTKTNTPGVTPTFTNTNTPLPATATYTASSTFTPTQTPQPPTATHTPSPTQTPAAPTNTNTAMPTATNTSASDLIFADDFESGNFSAWSSSTTNGGNLSVTANAALHGNYGMQAVFANTTGMYVTDDTPTAEPHYRARFYFDPNSITMTDGNAQYIFTGYDASASVFQVDFRFSAGSYQLRLRQYNDAGGVTSTSWVTISDASHSVELEWWAASAAGANNGGVTLWIDGVQSATLTGIDNDTRRIEYVRLGAVSGIDAGTLGTYYLDAFESRRSSYIGPLAYEAPHLYHFASLQQQSGSLTFTPLDDAYIQNSSPTTNAGSATTLQVDNSPILHFLLKFDVSGVSGQSIASAKIRLYNTNGSTKGGDFYRVADNTWQEETVTWSNAPAADTTLLASLGSVSPGTWYEVDITSLLTGDGTYSLRVSSTSTNGADYSSKEGANPPQLVITLGGTSTPTATAPATNTPTRTPTATPSSTPAVTNTPTATAVPTQTPTATVTFTPTPPPSVPVTINYVYDPLNRLTEANYSNGDYYHYAYDAVGNRETQSKSVLGLVTNDTYVYDDANRLSSLNGVIYTWDNNGNLKKDGVNAYEYDFANRLMKTCQDTSGNGICDAGETVLASYVYNGLNDRLRETINGSTTTFTMDLNTGLTQALSDGTNTYIYGNGRIAQVNGTNTEHFLGDALGSVRQMTQGSGVLTYAKAYDPYGVVTSTTGASQSAYGYTGEYASQGLVYLRARMYTPGVGRFLTRDTWTGDYNSPLSLNHWNYTSSNPVNFTDPSGHCINPDGSITWWRWPWFSWGNCPPVASGPDITLTPTLLVIIATATACATPAPSATNTPTGTSTPVPTLDPTSLPVPNISEIPDYETTPENVKQTTITRYGEIRKSLYAQDKESIDETGKIRDDILATLIISAELAVLHDLHPNVYPEAIEAVSNQYDSGRRINFSNPGNMRCYGKCTVTTQIEWLYDMEGIRANNFVSDKVTSGKWTAYLSDGQAAVNGYVHGQNTSWFWGNVTKEQLKCYLIVEQVYDPALYPGRPYFIVQSGKSGIC